MNHDHDRSRSLFSRSRPLLIHELTFGVRAGSGGPRLRPRDFQLAGSPRRHFGMRASQLDLRPSKVSFPKKVRSIPRRRIEPYFDFPLAPLRGTERRGSPALPASSASNNLPGASRRRGPVSNNLEGSDRGMDERNTRSTGPASADPHLFR